VPFEIRVPGQVAVIGAGEMGHGIAELAALKGYEVRLRDIKQEFLDRGMERIRWSLGKLVEKAQIRQGQMDEALGRIRPTLRLDEAVRDVDLVIEAVFEDLELKKRVFRELDRAAPEAILASNTSAIPITQMARVTKRPERVVGLHFFNPPMLMPLVEVIRADTTSDATVDAAVAFVKSLGRTAIVVRKDVPGFITTRVLGPYIDEAVWIHDQEGVPIETIDSAMRFRAGFPMGPFELADQIGIDVIVLLTKNAGRPVPPSVQRVHGEKRLGRKTGRGFYSYEGGRPMLTPDMGSSFEPLRILAPVINEAAQLVEMEVAAPGEIDEAMRLGTAFPKGPLALADELGADVVLAALRGHPRAKPAGLLEAMVARGDLGVKSGKGFYDHRPSGTAMHFETLLVAKDEATHVATVTLNRPDRLNTLNPQMFDELERALGDLERDDAVRCVVLTGSGDRAFSAGADLTAFSDVTKAFKVWRFSRRAEDVMNRVANFPKPTVASLNGYAFGGGLELALACDFRIAARRAKVGQTEIRLGLVPGAGGSQRLLRILGEAKAKELVMLGSRLGAEEALALGILTKVVENEALEAETRAFAERLAQGPPVAMQLAKVLLNRGGGMALDAALELEALAFGLATSSEDLYEGIQAFMEKREPKFKGE
jgi:enoyl-CoA hydratase/3-hydroxyacyl-CoA dehydrogenase